MAMTNMTMTNMTMTNMTMPNMDMNMNLTNMNLTNMNLTDMNLANMNLTNMNLTNMHLTNMNLTNMNLTNMDMDNMDINMTNIPEDFEDTAPKEEEYEKMYSASIEMIILLSIFYGAISISAIFGNSLVIWVVITTRQMHTVTNLYIANLALADVIIGMFCVPFQFQAAITQRWYLPEFMCAFCPFVQAISVNVSVLTLTAIAVDRHRAIINPLRARPKRFISKIIITAIWILSIAFSIPFAIAFRVIDVEEKFRDNGVSYYTTKPFCQNVNLSNDELKATRYSLFCIQYVMPFCIISFVYIQMAIKLWGSRTPGNAQDARDITLLKNKKKVIKMLIIVVVVFGVCWLPLQAYNVLYVTWPSVNEYRFINVIWFFCDWLAMSNSCYNPFIYGIYNEKFKREFSKRFSLCFYKMRKKNFKGANGTRTSCLTRGTSIRSTNGNSSTRNRHLVVLPKSNLKTGAKKKHGFGSKNNLMVSYKINGPTEKKLNSVVYYGNPSNKGIAGGSRDMYDNNDSVVSIALSNINENYLPNPIHNTGPGGVITNDIISSESDSFLTSSNNDSTSYNQNKLNLNLTKIRQINEIDEKSLKNQFSSIFKTKKNKNKKVKLKDTNMKLLSSSSSSSGTGKQLNFGSNNSNFEIGDGLRMHKGRITDTKRMTLENLANNYESNEMSVIGYPLLNSTMKGDSNKHKDSYLY